MSFETGDVLTQTNHHTLGGVFGYAFQDHLRFLFDIPCMLEHLRKNVLTFNTSMTR